MFFVYLLLILIAALMLIPFIWMLSASFKLNKDVFTFPIEWIPSNPAAPELRGYLDPHPAADLHRQYGQADHHRHAAAAVHLVLRGVCFAKLKFKGKNTLFLGYIATIALPWQAYMVPQFMMLRSWGLNNTHLAIILLQAFSAFGVFLMKQFYEGVPTELCEAARIDGLSEYGIWRAIMLPLSKPAISTLVIFHLRFHLERLPGSLDLPDRDPAQDHPDRPAHVHQPVFCGIRPDHGGVRHCPDPRADRLPVAAEVLRAGRRIRRLKG